MPQSIPRLLIGTAQWGLNYGITNKAGQLSDSSIRSLIYEMQLQGINDLDTAAGYGNAETRINELAPSTLRVQTKVSGKSAGGDAVLHRIRHSMSTLNRTSLDGVLIHDWFELTPEDQAVSAQQLEQAQSDALTTSVGISIYSPDELPDASKFFSGKFTAQIPLNVLDQRFIDSHSTYPDVNFQARSIFLQGLLLTSVNRFAHHSALHTFETFCQDNGLSRLEASMAFISQQPWLESCVIAPTSASELHEILNALERARTYTDALDFSICASTDADLVDPRSWV